MPPPPPSPMYPAAGITASPSSTPAPVHALTPGLAPLPGSGLASPMADAAPDIVTGDAVVLDMAPAGLLTRTGAALIDAVPIIAATVGMWFLLSTLDLEEAWEATLAVIAIVLTTLVWPIALETLTRGRSLGKMALGLRVVRDDGGPIRLRHAVIRVMVGSFEIWTMAGCIAVICAFINRRGKRLGDLLAGTYVVTERPPRSARLDLVMPAGLQAWAAGTDLGRPPQHLVAAARQMLMRQRTMTPQAAAQNLQSLAQAMSSYVSPPPPPGVPADVFLMAVLAERSRRDLERLSRQAERGRAREQQLHGLGYCLD